MPLRQVFLFDDFLNFMQFFQHLPFSYFYYFFYNLILYTCFSIFILKRKEKGTNSGPIQARFKNAPYKNEKNRLKAVHYASV